MKTKRKPSTEPIVVGSRSYKEMSLEARALIVLNELLPWCGDGMNDPEDLICEARALTQEHMSKAKAEFFEVRKLRIKDQC